MVQVKVIERLKRNEGGIDDYIRLHARIMADCRINIIIKFALVKIYTCLNDESTIAERYTEGNSQLLPNDLVVAPVSVF